MKNVICKSISVFLATAVLLSCFVGLNIVSTSAAEVVGGILNGDFENGTTSFQNPMSGSYTFRTEEEEGNTSNHVLHVTGSGWPYGRAYVYQDITVEANTDYVWTFRSKETSGANQANFAAVLGGGSFTTALDTKIKSHKGTDLGARQELGWWVKNGVNSEWDTFYVYFSSGENTVVRLEYIPYTSARNAYLDDWRLYKGGPGEIQNGGFENGTEFFYKDSDISTYEFLDDVAGANGKCLHVAGSWSGTRGKFWQDIPVKSGTDYAISFRLRCTTDNNGAYVKILGSNISFTMKSQIGTSLTSNDNGIYAKVPTANTWDTFNVYFNSGANETVRIEFNLFVPSATRSSYIDDMVMAERQAGEILNGGFEDGNAAFFERQNNTYVTKFSTESGITGANGKCLNISGSDPSGNGKFWQDVKVEPNTDYIWSFRMKEKTNDNKVHLINATGVDGSNTYIITSITTTLGTAPSKKTDADGWYVWSKTTWITVKCYFNSGDNTVVRLLDNAFYYDRDTYIDDWKLTENRFKDHSLGLNDAIGVNFFVDLTGLSAAEISASYMTFKITKGTGGTIVDVNKGAKVYYNSDLTDGNKYGFTCPVSSVGMAESITPTFYYTRSGVNKVIEGESYKVKDYIDYVNANQGGFESDVITLVNAIGNYGYYAQQYMSNKTSGSLTAGTDYTALTSTYGGLTSYSDIQTALSAFSAFDKNGVAFTYGLNYSSYNYLLIKFATANATFDSVLLKDDSSVYTDKTQSYTASTATLQLKLPILKLNERFLITGKLNGNDYTIDGISALNYIYGILSGSNTYAKNAVSALYDYYTAAAVYAAS